MVTNDKMFDLNNKNIIITGAAGLLGTFFCEAIIEYNGNPIALDIDNLKLKLLKKNIKEKYKKDILTFNIDITNEKQIKNNSIKLNKKLEKIDALINNAAFNPNLNNRKNKFHNNKLENFDLIQWQKELDITLTGSFLCSKYYGTIISKNKQGGTIINISSDLGIIAPNQDLYKNINKDGIRYYKPVSYSVVKSGIIGLTRYLSTYWSHKNIRCNALCPGGIEVDQPLNFKKRISNLIPLKRMAKKEDYLSTIIWMLSDKSSYLNGAIISVDGGRTAW